MWMLFFSLAVAAYFVSTQGWSFWSWVAVGVFAGHAALTVAEQDKRER